MGLKSTIVESLPRWAQGYMAYRHARRDWECFLRSHTRRRELRFAHPGAVVPDFVLANTALMKPEDLHVKRNQYHFHASGLVTAQQFMAAAVRHGLDIERLGSVLEFGCGGARVIRHLSGLDGIKLVGTDLLADNIGWCRKNIPGVEFHRNYLEPPLSFAENDSFDLVFAYSVFTHIPLPDQLPWLSELRRILKPGGFLVITVLDENLAAKMLSAEQMKTFRAQSHFTLGSHEPNASESTKIIDSWDVFMMRQYVEELYGQVMKVCDYQPSNQSVVVMRRD